MERIHLSMQEMQVMWVWSLGWEGPLGKETATSSSILAWKIPWTEEPDGLQSMESQRVGHDWACIHTHTHTHTHTHRFLNKWTVKLPYDPAIPLLDIYPEKTTIQKESCTPMFIAALFTIARTWKQPRCPLTVEWYRSCGTYIQWTITLI